MGYGYVQFSINGDFVHLAVWLMALLVFVKIVTTSLTIGSGGSGGVFGPGMVIGGFLGASLWAVLHTLVPGLVAGTNAGAFAVVGMGAFFGGVAKAPLAVILMVAEMTGDYALIVPAMLATMVAYLVTGQTRIYEGQVLTRLDSPAHKNDFALPLLQTLTVGEVITAGPSAALATAPPTTSVNELSRLLRERRVSSIPILDEGHVVGIVTGVDLGRVAPAEAPYTEARQIMSRDVMRAYPEESLYEAWLRMSQRGLRQLVVVDPSDPTRLLGMLTTELIGQVLSAQVSRYGQDSPLESSIHAPADQNGAPLAPSAEIRDTRPSGLGDDSLTRKSENGEITERVSSVSSAARNPVGVQSVQEDAQPVRPLTDNGIS
jgi:CIC family chloride channel protein